MPKYDYEVKIGELEISGNPTVYKGTVEAPDPRSACFVAYLHSRLGDDTPPWPEGADWTAGPDWLEEHHQGVEDGDEAFSIATDEELRNHPEWGTSCVFIDDDWQHEVDVTDHDQDGPRKPQEVTVLVDLTAVLKDANAAVTWEQLQGMAMDLVRKAVQKQLRHEHLVGPVEFSLKRDVDVRV